jgi:hypothetical protein
MTPLKVQVNFDFPLFENKTNMKALETCLDELHGYLFVHDFSNSEKITFSLLSSIPRVKHWLESHCE